MSRLCGAASLAFVCLATACASHPITPATSATRTPRATARVSASPSETSTPSASATPSASPTVITPTPTSAAAIKAVNGWRTSTLDVGKGQIDIAVQVEASLTEDPNAVGQRVISTLNDPRGWAGLGKTFHLIPNAKSAGIVVHLATPATVDKMCAPLQTAGYVSCSLGANVWLNVNRWREGVPHIPDLETYRTYVISHEVGHSLGRGHVNCPGKGLPAPVMQQQTYGLQSCVANGWITVA